MKKKKLLLVGWDAADWKIIHPLLDAGQMPALARLVNQGVSGNLATLEPALSPMLWTSIATGKMAYHHGVVGFTEVDPRTQQVVPVSAATRTCRTVWEMLADHGLRSHIVSWFATQGEQDLPGKMVSNLFCHLRDTQPGQDPDTYPAPPAGSYWPLELAEEMNSLRVSPSDIDPDEVIRLFVPRADEIDQTKDRRLRELAELLAQAFSVHNAATHLMATDPDWDFMAVYYRTIDEISHHFMHLHPPRMEGLAEEDFERYQHVVNSTYRLHDLFLARLVDLAGPDAAILLVSDHGYHSDHLRPKFTPRVPAGITVWHRPHGVLAAAGPGLRQDTLVHGARLLDITPTILHWFGLPVGDDMEGRVLREAFSEAKPIQTIATWEREDGVRHPRTAAASSDRQALLEQFVALGYIDELPSDPGQAVHETRRENDWNLARACLFAGRFEQALPLLQSCHRAQSFRADYAQALARCQLKLGLHDEAQTTIDSVLNKLGDPPGVRMVRALVALERGRADEALESLESIRASQQSNPQMQAILARAFLRAKRIDEAEDCARSVLEADPHDFSACMVLARVAFARGDAQAAVMASLDAVAIDFGSPDAHYLLGASLMQQSQWTDAERALNNCLRLAPRHARAHRLLARVYEKLERNDQAVAHRALSISTLIDRREDARRRSETARQSMAARATLWASEDQEREAQVAERAAKDSERAPIECVVVCGLPRSGTSLMMQILRAGGIEPLTDGERVADEDNPEGYWEWEPIKRLPKDPRVIEEAHGKAIKVISALLPHLPSRHRYHIIYMSRPVEQVVASQWRMLERQGRQPASERRHLIEMQKRFNANVLSRLRARKEIHLLEVCFPDLISDPGTQIQGLSTFLGDRFTVGPNVLACVKPALFRNRIAVQA